jgi:hypothetical protein
MKRRTLKALHNLGVIAFEAFLLLGFLFSVLMLAKIGVNVFK